MVEFAKTFSTNAKKLLELKNGPELDGDSALLDYLFPFS